MAEEKSPAIETRALSRRFGALTAVDDVSLRVRAGGVHAVIGPNGAGKSTLINLLSGKLKPSSGEVLVKGRDVTGWPGHRIARLGMGRSFQKINVFPDFSCLDNCRLGALARLPSAFRLFRPAAGYAEARRQAEDALFLCGLAEHGEMPAAALSHGRQRQLEVAIMLAAGPDVLLLDEPLAGMGPEESGRMLDLLRSLAGPRTLVLIEHDMDAVFAIADEVTVLVNGRLLETGTPEAMRASPAVRQAYLGEEA